MFRTSKALLRQLFHIQNLKYIIFGLLAHTQSTSAQPAPLLFSDCSSGVNLSPSLKINITDVFGQIINNGSEESLNIVAFGATGKEIEPFSNATNLLATLFTSSTILTFDVYDNSSFVCSTLRPPSPLPAFNNATFYCPIAPGPIAFSSSIPIQKTPNIFTINSQLRIVDTSEPAIELCCIDVAATPLNLDNDGLSGSTNVYGRTIIIFWVSVASVIAYWILTGFARISAAWGRAGLKAGDSWWYKSRGVGFILASAISGESLASMPALMRFCTPSMRDIFYHTQWCAILSMIAVQWPVFVYPFFVQTAWTTLSFNITLTQGENSTETRYNPVEVPFFSPPSNYADQISDPTSPLFLNSSLPNRLFVLPPNTPSGIATFAYTIGVRPQDLFGICLALFLCIMGGTIIISGVVWLLDLTVSSLLGDSMADFTPRSSNSPYILAGKEVLSASPDNSSAARASSHLLAFHRASLPIPSVLKGGRWRHRIRPNSFHGSVLHGNLIRILILFHLPITTFSCYQFTAGRPQSSVVSIALAAVCFVVFSLAIPIWLVSRLLATPTTKLYDETRTLLMLGPLYNSYNHGSQLFACLSLALSLAYGIVIGCGQKSGTAQAIIVLVVEVASALATSIWLPWGRGASMGVLSFFFCVARIIIAVLLVILTPVVSVGDQAGGWIAAAVLFILGLIYASFIMILLVKISEALVRLFGKIPFNQSRHSIDSGFLGVLGLVGCCGPKRQHKSSQRAMPSGGPHPDSAAFDPQFSSLSTAKHSTPRSSTAGPPSVLRPEQALRPYREESDDENGFIMGAWQPFPHSGYTLVDNQQHMEAASPPPSKSGFSKIGGGRAHFNSPYAIVSSQHQQSPLAESHVRPVFKRDPPSTVSDHSVNDSVISVNHKVASGSPPGAASMAPAHIRTQSQTAIVEDASVLHARSHMAALIKDNADNLSAAVEQPDDNTLPRRKLWFNLRRNRRMSEGSYGRQPDQMDEELPSNGRSFVVVREKRPNLPSAQSVFPKSRDGSENDQMLSSPLRSSDTAGTMSVSSTAPQIPRRSSRRMSHT